MFKFTVKNAQLSESHIPYKIESEGKISDEEAFDKTGLCQVNGIILIPGDRISVEGQISTEFPVAIHRKYGVEFQKKELQSVATFGSVTTLFDKAGIPNAEYSTWRITLAWDGCDLGIFPLEKNTELKILSAV